MARRRYYQDYSQIRHRIQTLRAFIAQKHRGFVRQVAQRFGEDYPLVQMSWWYVQHIGQLKLTITERLNKAERMLEARRLTKERIERIKTYLDETEELTRRLADLSQRFEAMVREPYVFERKVISEVVRLMQGKKIDYSQLPREVVVAMEYYLAFMTKRTGVASYLSYRGLHVINDHFPKVRVQLYVMITLSKEVIYQGKKTKHITVKTPYILHVDDYVANKGYYDEVAIRHTLNRLNLVMAAGWGVDDYEVDARIRERVE